MSNYTNSIYLFYDLQKRQYFDPRNADIPVTSITFTRGDSVMLRVQAVNTTDGLTINKDNTVPVSFTEDLSNYTTFVFGIKTRQNYMSGSNFAQSFVQYDTNDDFYNPTSSSFAIPITIVSATSATGSYVCSYHLATDSGSFMTFGSYAPLECNVVQQVVIGSENVLPQFPVNLGTAIISGSTDNVIVPYLGMTPSGIIFVSWMGNPSSTLSAIGGVNQFIIQAGGPMTNNTEVAYNVYAVTS